MTARLRKHNHGGTCRERAEVKRGSQCARRSWVAQASRPHHSPGAEVQQTEASRSDSRARHVAHVQHVRAAGTCVGAHAEVSTPHGPSRSSAQGAWLASTLALQHDMALTNGSGDVEGPGVRVR